MIVHIFLNRFLALRIESYGGLLTVPTVLVVDDEPLIRKMVALILEHDGFCVLTAGNGIEAIHVSHAHGGAIDLLVSDVRMPLMDGYTLATELQAENPALPVLLMSGFCEDQSAASRNRFPILSKPFSMASLLRHVHSLLSQEVAVAVGSGSVPGIT